jgi:C-terminal processing protease CtpA/Prc
MSSPICILVNANTVCAAGMFSHLMRSLVGAVLIGNSKTQGTYATTHDLIIGGCKVRMNSIVTFTPYPETDINSNGVYPDIYVTLSKVEDLYPYDDKILQTALKYLKYSYSKKAT